MDRPAIDRIAHEAWLRSSPSRFYWRNRSMDTYRAIVATTIHYERGHDQTACYRSGAAKRISKVMRAIEGALTVETLANLLEVFMAYERK